MRVLGLGAGCPGEQVEALPQLTGGGAPPLLPGPPPPPTPPPWRSWRARQLDSGRTSRRRKGGSAWERGRPGTLRWHARRGAWLRAPEARGGAGSSGRAHATRVRAPSRHAGRPGPLSVQTAAPADARAPIGAPRPPPAAPEAPGPQLLGGWTRRGPAPPPARPRPRGPWSRGPARGRPPARRFMERPRPGRRGQRDPAGPCEPPAPRHHGTQGPACPPAYPPTCPLQPSARTARRPGGRVWRDRSRSPKAPLPGSPPGRRRSAAALGGKGVKFLGWGPGRRRTRSCWALAEGGASLSPDGAALGLGAGGREGEVGFPPGPFDTWALEPPCLGIKGAWAQRGV